MISKYTFGKPFPTEAVVTDVPAANSSFPYGEIQMENGFQFTYIMDENDIIYGLGEANRGLNKRGYIYISDCADDCEHTEDKRSLYGAHNLIIVDGQQTFGLFFDYPAALTFDIGYTKHDILKVSCDTADLALYLIEGKNSYDIVKQFRKIIGRSYIPPKFAFGYGQSRWGYKTKEDFRTVVKNHREQHIPLDMVYMDIDYMQSFKDFTFNEEHFSDFPEFVKEMKAQNIHLIPIIDAGVKIEKGYDVYEEGVANGYFCQREDGSNFVAAVWPGFTHFPDMLNEEARVWFGDKYQILLDSGIDGFWNDMNEPAIFYSEEGMNEMKKVFQKVSGDTSDLPSLWHQKLQADVAGLANHPDDYKRFFHKVNGEMIRHDKVHNLFGYNMTRAAREAFERLRPDERILMFSRSSYVGMHRYGGIWTGDNKSWWSHILLNLQMMPSLNMCGFLYSGADLGGFGADATYDLLLRWLELGIFTPLMRNHSATGTRYQEFYQFEHPEYFRHVIGVRYRLIPYLYSEFMKAALHDDMYFKPLSFVYPEDQMARYTDDQIMLGNEVMIAPVYKQNARGRYVYLPEEMMFVKFLADGTVTTEILEKGHHYVEIALEEVSFFIRKGTSIPLGNVCENITELDDSSLELLGYEHSEYLLYSDDGIHKNYENPDHYRVLRK